MSCCCHCHCYKYCYCCRYCCCCRSWQYAAAVLSIGTLVMLAIFASQWSRVLRLLCRCFFAHPFAGWAGSSRHLVCVQATEKKTIMRWHLLAMARNQRGIDDGTTYHTQAPPATSHTHARARAKNKSTWSRALRAYAAQEPAIQYILCSNIY